MSGADAKTMPVSREYEEGFERTFGERKPIKRGTFVSRCSECDGVVHGPDERLYRCPRCGKDTYGLVDISIAPPPAEAAINAPIMVDRFYENTCVTELDDKNRPLKVDIGSRMKHREYMKQRGLTTVDDYKDTWKKAEAERAKIRAGEPMPDRERRDQLGRVAYELEKRRRK